jgi:predicted enzyme related to lactoylglutathione lyase
MSLWSSKLVYIFLDTSDISAQRVFFEDVMGLKVIENDFRPPHPRHGVVKYDAGNTIVALNIADSGFDAAGSDNVVALLGATPAREAEIYADLQIQGFSAPPQPGAVFRDRDNHEFALYRPSFSDWGDDPHPVSLDELHLQVSDLAQSLHFYSDQLGLQLLQLKPEKLVFSAGDLKLVLHVKPKVRIEPRRGFLMVFSTPDIQETHGALQKSGLQFRAPVRFSEIGGSVRFIDPSGHVYCLYQPSEECLGWGSGETLMRIISGQKTRHGEEMFHSPGLVQ